MTNDNNPPIYLYLLLGLIAIAVCMLATWPVKPPPVVTPTANPPTIAPTATHTRPAPTATMTQPAEPTATYTPTRTPTKPPTATPIPPTPVPTATRDYRWWNCAAQMWVDYPRYSWSACR